MAMAMTGVRHPLPNQCAADLATYCRLADHPGGDSSHHYNRSRRKAGQGRRGNSRGGDAGRDKLEV